MKHRIRRASRERRGVAIIVVLGLISIAMALSYTMMRAQGTTLKIQQNSRRRADARQAALSGMMAALGHLHQADWTGVGSTLVGNVSDRESYTVLYTNGDARLTPTSPDFAQWPYRLTLDVTGYAEADDGGAAATHRLRAIARFVPKAVSAAPPDWSHMQQFSLYQWTADSFSVQLPARIDGPVWMQGQLFLCEHYPSTGSSRRRYLSDLNAMRNAGRPDYRPLSGPVHWRNIQTTSTVDLVTQNLGVTVQTATSRTASNWNHPGALETYRLYIGGQEYEVPRLEQTLENVTLAPDPQTNPLGLFVREGGLELRDNVNVTGQVIATGDIVISGRNVRLKSHSLVGIHNTSEPVCLPVLLAGDDFRVYSGAAATIQGMVLAWDEAEVHEGTESTEFALQGRLVCKQFTVGLRSEWNYGSTTWGTLYDIFQWQYDNQNGVKYFPEFLVPLGRRPAPKIVFTRDSTPRVDHFPQSGQPVYAPHGSDAGLRWELVDFRDEG